MTYYLLPILAQAAALIRVRTLPGRRYGWFTIYLFANIARGILLWLLAERRDRYSWAWFYSEPVIEALWLLMAYELYERVSGLYPGLGRKSWAVAALLLAALATWATTIEPHKTYLERALFSRRATATILAVAIALLATLFGYFRNSLPRNSVVHAFIMAGYSLTQAAGYLGENIDPRSRILNWGEAASRAAIVAYAAWAYFLKPDGETRPPVDREFSDPDLEGAGQRTEEVTRAARQIGRGNTAG